MKWVPIRDSRMWKKIKTVIQRDHQLRLIFHTYTYQTSQVPSLSLGLTKKRPTSNLFLKNAMLVPIYYIWNVYLNATYILYTHNIFIRLISFSYLPTITTTHKKNVSYTISRKPVPFSGNCALQCRYCCAL